MNCSGHTMSDLGGSSITRGRARRRQTRLQALADHAGLIGWDVSVDSTIMRAHQLAAGARRAMEKGKAALSAGQQLSGCHDLEISRVVSRHKGSDKGPMVRLGECQTR